MVVVLEWVIYGWSKITKIAICLGVLPQRNTSNQMLARFNVEVGLIFWDSDLHFFEMCFFSLSIM